MNATVIRHIRQKRLRKAKEETGLERKPSRIGSIHESLYTNRMGFLKRATRRLGFGGRVQVNPQELHRIGSIQAQQTGATLARHPSRSYMKNQKLKNATTATASGGTAAAPNE